MKLPAQFRRSFGAAWFGAGNPADIVHNAKKWVVL
jgi:hypothetical protein